MEKIGKTPENSGNLKIEKLRNVRKPRETSRKVGKIRKTKENSEKSKKFNNSEIVEKLGKHPIKSEKLGKTPLLLDLAEYLSQKKFDSFLRKNMFFGV